MNDKVEEYLNKKRKEYEDARAKKLIDLGIYEKEYSPSSEGTSSEYPYSEYNENTYTWRYYKKIPCSVTDEEYEEIMKYSNTSVAKVDDISNADGVFKGVAIIIWILGFIGGAITIDEFSWISAFSVWTGTFIFGLQIFGMGKIIELLSDIKYKLK